MIIDLRFQNVNAWRSMIKINGLPVNLANKLLGYLIVLAYADQKGTGLVDVNSLEPYAPQAAPGHIYRLRKELGMFGNIIVNVHGKGYKLVLPNGSQIIMPQSDTKG